MMDTVSLIARKRDGQALRREEIRFLVSGITDGTIPDYQAAALLMACYIRGMDEAETRALTEAMMHSGDILDLSEAGGFTCDKHSTGGVGDKITMIIAPLAASLGIKVPMYSGRGLGHTGGTIDKLDAIPGLRTTLDVDDFMACLKETGIANSMQTDRIAPADKRLYALRDVTATVDSIPLITASIMSKKLACGANGLVLDVKFGDGAFMRTEAEARELARWLIRMAPVRNIRVAALLDRMDDPLGRYVGNGLEIEEAIRVLAGEPVPDLQEVSIAIVREMLRLKGETGDLDDRILTALADGSARTAFRKWIAWCGGDTRVVDDPTLLKRAPETTEVYLDQSGTVAAIRARAIGMAAVYLGAGRLTKEDTVDPGAGLVLHRVRAETVTPDEPVATLYHTRCRRPVQDIVALVRSAYTITDGPVTVPPRIVDILR